MYKDNLQFIGSWCTNILVVDDSLKERSVTVLLAKVYQQWCLPWTTGVGNWTVGTILSSLADHFLPPSRSPEKSSLLFALEPRQWFRVNPAESLNFLRQFQVFFEQFRVGIPDFAMKAMFLRFLSPFFFFK